MFSSLKTVLFFLVLVASVLAQASSSDVVDHGMDMTMDMGMQLASGQMVPYLHFQRGDVLWFQGWVPQSNGALAGTCLGVFLLAILDRWLGAMRRSAEVHWHKRAQLSLAKKLNAQGRGQMTPTLLGTLTLRTIPPFNLSHDLPRGLLYGAQSFLNFAFMLAAMTFNAGIIIAIVVGLGIGESLFGRCGASGVNVH